MTYCPLTGAARNLPAYVLSPNEVCGRRSVCWTPESGVLHASSRLRLPNLPYHPWAGFLQFMLNPDVSSGAQEECWPLIIKDMCQLK